jgi:hypothetical protein
MRSRSYAFIVLKRGYSYPTCINNAYFFQTLSAIERFDAQNSREMPRDLVPTLTLVKTAKD